MKTIILFIFLNFPFSLFPQYTEVWKGDFNYDAKEKNSFASKIKIALGKNIICVTSIGKTEKTIFSTFTLEGKLLKENRPSFFWEQSEFNKQLGIYDEQYQSLNSINKFDLIETLSGFGFYSITSSKSFYKPFLVQLNLDTNSFFNGFNSNSDTLTRTRNYSAILGDDNTSIMADTVWFGYGNGEVKIQNYFLHEQTVDPRNYKKLIVLSPDTISADNLIANLVPVAIKRSEDNRLVVIIASEEKESSEAIGVSCRIVDENFQEVKRFFLPPELFNLNGKLLSIKDAIVTKNSIYFVGNVYLYNSSSNALIAKCDLDGSNFKSTTISNEGSVFKSIEILNDTTIIAVGASKNVTHQSNTHKFLAEFDEKVDIRFTKEWSTNNQDTLYDIERVNNNEFIVVGSEDGFPFMEKLQKYTVSSVRNYNEQSSGIDLNYSYILPNPAAYSFVIKFIPTSKEELTLFLIDNEGKFIIERLLTNVVPNLENSFTISTSDLINGMYTVVIKQGNKLISTKLVVIN